MSIARFPLEKRDGPSSVFVCRCGHADHEHHPNKYGYPCRLCENDRFGPGIKSCAHFYPVKRPTVTVLPPRRQVSADVGAWLQGVAASVLADSYPLRPNLAIVVLLNETDSFAVWGGGPIGGNDETHASQQIHAMREHARDWWEWRRAKGAKASQPVQRSVRAARNSDVELQRRMRTIYEQQFPCVCDCGERFATDRGLTQHQKTSWRHRRKLERTA